MRRGSLHPPAGVDVLDGENFEFDGVDVDVFEICDATSKVGNIASLDECCEDGSEGTSFRQSAHELRVLRPYSLFVLPHVP